MGIFICDLSSGQECRNISFRNEIDDETISAGFEYTSVNVPGSGSCRSNFETVPRPCSCDGECCKDICSCASHYGFSYVNKMLLEECFNTHKNSKLVIECSCLCKCKDSCPNRVVQHGIQCELQVFKTEKKGFGVRTLASIPRFTFICEYAGEVISLQQANARIARTNNDQPNYIFVLKEYSSEGQITKTVVDPTYVGNVGRFINHSCCPNLVLVPVRTDSMVPKICFFASSDILPLEELCYDYGGKMFTGIAPNLIPEGEQPFTNSAKKCFCESRICTGYLPCDPDVFS